MASGVPATRASTALSRSNAVVRRARFRTNSEAARTVRRMRLAPTAHSPVPMDITNPAEPARNARQDASPVRTRTTAHLVRADIIKAALTACRVRQMQPATAQASPATQDTVWTAIFAFRLAIRAAACGRSVLWKQAAPPMAAEQECVL